MSMIFGIPKEQKCQGCQRYPDLGRFVSSQQETPSSRHIYPPRLMSVPPTESWRLRARKSVQAFPPEQDNRRARRAHGRWLRNEAVEARASAARPKRAGRWVGSNSRILALWRYSSEGGKTVQLHRTPYYTARPAPGATQKPLSQGGIRPLPDDQASRGGLRRQPPRRYEHPIRRSRRNPGPLPLASLRATRGPG
jgi:hypothetical protein